MCSPPMPPLRPFPLEREQVLDPNVQCARELTGTGGVLAHDRLTLRDLRPWGAWHTGADRTSLSAADAYRILGSDRFWEVQSVKPTD